MHEQLAELPSNLSGHLQLTLMALFLGIVISVPLGIWVTRRPRWQAPVVGAAGVIQTIPTLALLAVMVPLLSALGRVTLIAFGFAVPGFGYVPALIAITLYSVLPILQNTVTAIRGVDRALIKAAKGVGMTPLQQLFRVELPLAMPVIVAGVRTAAVWVVGMATIATPVGARSLGNYIFSGLQTRHTVSIVFGCIAAAALALTLDGLIFAIQKGIAESRRLLLWIALGCLASLFAYAAGALFVSGQGRLGNAQIRIGAKPFTEQFVLSEILRATLASKASQQAEIFGSLGSTVVFDALRQGDIDMYVDYMGTLWTTALGHANAISPAGMREAITRELNEQHGVLVVCSLGFENAYAFAMRESHAESLGIKTLSDLSGHAPTFRLGSDYEFLAREEWKSVRGAYGMAFRKTQAMDPSLMYQAITEKAIDVITAYTTDGRIRAFDLRLLRDDKHVIPPYDALLLVNARFAKRHPRVVEVLRRLEGKLTTQDMQALNMQVDVSGRSPRKVASAFVRESVQQ
ncbi:MAG: ABC transporter permease/substrate-binding protein [Myxococcales bacterium]|nr:ABC transporter permease/substrate-binding protein [Myxococcales bacterium]